MNLLVVSGYPEKNLTHGEKTVGVASYTKNTLLALSRSDDSVRIRVLVDILNNTPETYTEDNIQIERVWQRKSYKSLMKLLFTILKSPEQELLIPFEMYMFGTLSHTTLYILVLAISSIMGKNITLVLHHVVEDVSQVEKKGWKRFLFKCLKDIFYTSLLAISKKAVVFEEEFKERLGNNKRVCVIPHAVEESKPLDKALARQELNLIQEAKYAMYFGYISPYKGVLDLINFWPDKKTDDVNKNFSPISYLQNKPDLRLIIAGAGNPNHMNNPEYADFVKEVMDKAAQKGIITTGFVPEKYIYLFFSAVDILILPYKTFFSSSGPLSLAFTHEKPVIFSENLKAYFKTKDMREGLVNAGLSINDVTFKLDSSLPDKIKWAVQNKEKFEKFSRYMKESRGWSKIGQRYVDLLREKR